MGIFEEPWFIVALIAGVVALVAAWANHAFWVRRLTVLQEYTEEHRVPTPDGSAIELRRLPAVVDSGLPPVLLVHGLGADHRNLDMTAESSLARHLAGAGRDVWLVTLRCGRTDLRFRERRLVTFNAMVKHDVPLAVLEVRQRTGATAIDYVGFSMGGMLLYAALGRTLPESQIRRAVTIGSPGLLAPPFGFLKAFRFLPRIFVPRVAIRILARLAAFAAEWLVTPLHRIFYNPRNVEKGAIARTLMNGIVDIAATLQADFMGWGLRSGQVLIDGLHVLDGLATIERPALIVAGAGDRIAPASSVRIAFEAWGRDHAQIEKQWLLLGRESGAAEDYGHGDLAVGKSVREDLHEPVARFLG